MLLGWVNVMVKKGKCRGEEENHSGCLRCRALLGGYMAVFSRAVLPRKWMFDRKRNGLTWKRDGCSKDPDVTEQKLHGALILTCISPCGTTRTH